MSPVAVPRGLPRPLEVARVLERVTETARRYGMFEPAGRVVVAVSGGPDSLCLLHALVRLRRLFRIDLVCFHFDHRLRTGSRRDAEYVRRQARALGVPFVLRSAETEPARGDSVEAWARTVRYRGLAAVLEELGGGVAAAGHTADDQAETVLLALLRGGGLEALSGMAPVTRPVVRPLIEVTREETVAFCRALRLRPRRDPMNEDPAYLRVAVRRRLIPVLEKAVGRRVTHTLARTATLLRQDAEFLEQLATEAAGRVVRADGDDRLLAADALVGLPRPLGTRVVRGELLGLGVVPEASHVDAVLALASGPRGHRANLSGGLLARKEKGYVRLSRAPSPGTGSRRRPASRRP